MGVVIVAVVAAAVLIAGWFVSGDPRVVRLRLRAPTAEEEGGESSSVRERELAHAPAVQDRVSSPKQGGAEGTTPVRRASLPQKRDPEMAGPGPLPEPLRRHALAEVAPGRMVHREAVIGRAQELGEGGSAVNDQGSGPGEIAAAQTPDRAPEMAAPVLLSPGALGYPSEGYYLVLDQNVLAPRLRADAAQGLVVLRILVRTDGSVAEVNVVESSGASVLDETAVRAAAGWTFAPATRDGQPIEAWVVVPVRFVIP